MEFSSQNTGVGSLCCLQGIFPTQGLNRSLPNCRWILYQLGGVRYLFCVSLVVMSSSNLHDSSSSRESVCNAEDPGLFPGSERSPWMRKWRSTPAVLPEESLWTEDPGGLHSIGSQSIRHDWVTSTHTLGPKKLQIRPWTKSTFKMYDLRLPWWSSG